MMHQPPLLFPFIEFHRISRIPFYKQIYEGYRSAILSGRFHPGQRLPSTRGLATELGISRLPVISAFEQLLHEGYVEGKVGSGTFVSESIPDELSIPEHSAVSENTGKWTDEGSNLSEAETILGPFRVSLPALDHFPMKTWARLVSRLVKHSSVEQMSYGDPAGYLPLRRAIAKYLRTARAVRCDADQILIVSGSQMALQLSARALLKKRSVVYMEEPGYPGARDALTSTGSRLIPIPIDGEGIIVRQMRIRGSQNSVTYVTPSHQYPLGFSMSASRRLDLLEWAQRCDGWIIEDDYDSEYRYASRPFGAMQGMDTTSRVIYIGTFSKVLFPALRIAYMVIPRELFKSFLKLRESFDIFSPTLYQLVLTDFIEEGHFARHLRRMRPIYLSRRNALVKNIESFLKPHNIDAGIHLSAFLPQNVDDCALVHSAAENGISLTALSTCYAGGNPRKGLILGFGGSNERQIKSAAGKLKLILSESR
jgi:GntR family transcriptional regulator/MocR family aminotransferase